MRTVEGLGFGLNKPPNQSVCRGVIFAIAHVRGGGDLGQYWYLDGRLGNKPNTFKDTVAAATHLIKVCDRLFCYAHLEMFQSGCG